MTKKKVVEYIVYLAKNPFSNLYNVAEQYFTERKGSMPEKLAVPELLELPPAKRGLAASIVKDKTNIDIHPDADNFESFLKIKEAGEIIHEVLPHSIQTVKWLLK